MVVPGGRGVRSAALPLVLGALIVVVAPSTGWGTLCLLAAAILLGIFRRDRAFAQGVLVTVPMVVGATTGGFRESWQLGLLVLVAAPCAMGLAGLAAAAGAIIDVKDTDPGRRRRAGIMLVSLAAIVGAVIVLDRAGHARVDRDRRTLETAVPSALAQVSGLELSFGAYNDTWAQLHDDLGALTQVSYDGSTITLLFDITPAIAPWLDRCLVATVAEITEEPIAAQAISFGPVSDAC